MANAAHRHERHADKPVQRHKHHRQSIRLQVANQVRAEDGHYINHGTGAKHVRHDPEQPEVVRPLPRGIREQIKSEHTNAHVRKDSADGDGLVVATIFDNLCNLRFAVRAVVVFTLGIDGGKDCLD